MECKEENELNELAEKSPNRYMKIDGECRCPPGEAYAEQFGLFYRVVSSKEFNQVQLRNFDFLEDYYIENTIDIPDEVKDKVVSLISTNPGILLKNLIDTSRIEADYIYRLLVQEEIYINIDLELLSEPDRCHVYANQQVALSYQSFLNTKKNISFTNCFVDIAPGKDVLWNGNLWTIVNIGEEYISVNSRYGGITEIRRDQFISAVSDGYIRSANNEAINVISQKINERLAQASMADHVEANRRYSIILPYLDGVKLLEADNLEETTRTIRNWIRSYLEAERAYGSGYIGLLPDTKRKGNRTPRISERVIAEFDAFMDETKRQKIRVKRRCTVRLSTDARLMG